MTERQAGLSPDFAAAFKAFLDQVNASAPERPGLFRERQRALFGAEPVGLPVVAQQFNPPEHPNLQRALEGYLASDGRQHEVMGVSGTHVKPSHGV